MPSIPQSTVRPVEVIAEPEQAAALSSLAHPAGVPPTPEQPATSEEAATPGHRRWFFVLADIDALAESGRLDDAAADLDAVVAVDPYAQMDARDLRDRYGISALVADHDVGLAKSDTPLISRQLVSVGGYAYLDAMSEKEGRPHGRYLCQLRQ